MSYIGYISVTILLHCVFANQFVTYMTQKARLPDLSGSRALYGIQAAVCQIERRRSVLSSSLLIGLSFLMAFVNGT